MRLTRKRRLKSGPSAATLKQKRKGNQMETTTKIRNP